MSHPQSEPNRADHEHQLPEHWLDRAIETARRRGDFDNLPNTGKRLNLDPISIDSEWGLAATVMKNAGVSAPWVELSREADAIEERMARLREHAHGLHTRQTSEQDASVATPPAETASTPSFWERIFRRKPDHAPQAGDAWLRASLTPEERRMRYRRQHAALAQELDQKLAEFHRRLPANLWRAQRLRRTVEAWNQRFDAECPPIENPPATRFNDPVS